MKNKKIIGILVTSLFLITIFLASNVNSKSQINNLIDNMNHIKYLQECLEDYFLDKESYRGDYEKYFDSLTLEERVLLDESLNTRLEYLQTQLVKLQGK